MLLSLGWNYLLMTDLLENCHDTHTTNIYFCDLSLSLAQNDPATTSKIQSTTFSRYSRTHKWNKINFGISIVHISNSAAHFMLKCRMWITSTLKCHCGGEREKLCYWLPDTLFMLNKHQFRRGLQGVTLGKIS